MVIEEGIVLNKHTTFRTGGEAKFFVKAKTDQQIKEAIAFAKEKNLPIFVLGGGSNILVNDSGFRGVVIKIETTGIEFETKGKKVHLTAAAGENWDELVQKTVENNFSGLENLSYIPGTVGAAPVQNIGAYGCEIKDSIEWVDAIDARDLSTKRFSKNDCRFAYRNSFFKTPEGKNFIITKVGFNLSKEFKPNIAYKELSFLFKDSTPTLLDVRNAVVEIRKKKLPDPKNIGTAGSFFKNPIVSRELFEKLKIEFPNVISYPVSDSEVKIAAGWLIDKVCNLKGVKIKNVGTFERQALAIVNFGGAQAEEIKLFAKKIQNEVKQKTKINLEWEVEWIE